MRWLVVLGLAACSSEPGRGLDQSVPQDLAASDFASVNDLANMNDLAIANDLSAAPDLAASADFSTPPDFTVPDLWNPVDTGAHPDFSTSPPDFSTANDLSTPPDLSPINQHVHIYISNTCVVSTSQTGMTWPLHVPLSLTFHNHSVDYDADVWMSYNGGYLGLAQGAEWNEPVQHCLNPVPYDFYADVSIAGGGSSACPSYRFLVHCQ